MVSKLLTDVTSTSTVCVCACECCLILKYKSVIKKGAVQISRGTHHLHQFTFVLPGKFMNYETQYKEQQTENDSVFGRKTNDGSVGGPIQR